METYRQKRISNAKAKAAAKALSKISIEFKGKIIKGEFVKNSTGLLFRCNEGNLFMKKVLHNKNSYWERANFETWSPRLFLSKRA